MNILVIAAHPDDEVLGCGGTIAKHVKNKDNVYVVIMSTGGRGSSLEFNAIDAKTILGYNQLYFEDLPDQKFDQIPLLRITQMIENYIEIVKPDIIYTHSNTDLNKDHRIIFEATLTASRPCSCNVKKLYSFEVLSSTEWGFTAFKPQLFVEIDVEEKLKAMECYPSEINEVRSLENIKLKAAVNGNIVLKKYCETFEIIRVIK